MYFLKQQNNLGRTVEIQYILNFHPKINEIITESKYMEQLGYVLPDIARNLALQVILNIFL